MKLPQEDHKDLMLGLEISYLKKIFMINSPVLIVS